MSTNPLCPERHKSLLQDVDSFCRTAGVPKAFLSESMIGRSPQKDILWVRNYPLAKETGKAGAALIGNDLDLRSFRVGAALLRNFIDARVLNLSGVLDLAKSGNMPEPTVLIIPNFYGGAIDTKATVAWKVEQLYDLLLHRYTTGLQTVIGIDSLKSMEASYGSVLSAFVKTSFMLCPQEGVSP